MAGFERADGVILAGTSQNFVNLAGDYVLEGTSGNDLLVAGSGNNIIRPFGGNNTVNAGDGDDAVQWARVQSSPPDWHWARDILSASIDGGTHFFIQGQYDGGLGHDRIEFRFDHTLGDPNMHFADFGWLSNNPTRKYAIDFSSATLNGFEHIASIAAIGDNGGVKFSYGPSEIYLTATQLSQVTSLAGTSFIVKGGGVLDLTKVQLLNGATLTVSGDQAYHVIGTALGESLATFGGNDTIYGGLGNDQISSGGGIDSIDAGDGNDRS
jgi:Ca2+-binding RTX toxin-like protein